MENILSFLCQAETWMKQDTKWKKLNKNPNYFSYLLFFFSFIHNFHSIKFIQSNQFRFFFFFFNLSTKERLHKLKIFITEEKWPTGSKMEMVHCCFACKWHNLWCISIAVKIILKDPWYQEEAVRVLFLPALIKNK